MERSRVLELPEDIIYHIFSHLSNQDAIRLSLASKQMLGLIEKRPTLAFNDPPTLKSRFMKQNYVRFTLDRYKRKIILLERFMNKQNYVCSTLNRYESSTLDRYESSTLDRYKREIILMERFMNEQNYACSTLDRYKREIILMERFMNEQNYVCSTLDRYERENILLETFTLKDPFYKDVSNRCIELAARKGLKILNIWMSDRAYEYSLSQPVFGVESLVELELRACHLKPQMRVVWPNLKRLSLTHGCEASEEAFENMIRGCPLIENLKFWYLFQTSYNYNFSKLHNLKQLNVRLDCRQRLVVNAISTPNLESIICEGLGSCDLGDDEFPKLKVLKLHCGGIDENFFANFARKFPILEYLSVKGNETWTRVNLSSTSLKEIRLSCMKMGLQEACFEVPNIRFINSENSLSSDISFIRNSGKWSSYIELYVLEDHIDASWFVELNELLVALKGSETSIVVHTNNKLEIHEAYQIDAKSIISIPWIREFSINAEELPLLSLSSASIVLDAIFSICQPQTVTFLNCKTPSPRLRQDPLDLEMFQDSARFKDWDKFVKVLNMTDYYTVKNISFSNPHRERH